MSQYVISLILTDWVDSQYSTGCVTRFSQASLVNGNDSKLILRALGQLTSLYGPVNDRPAVDFSPCQLSSLTFLHHVAQDVGFAIIDWGLPAHAHGVLCNVCDDRRFARSRNIYNMKQSPIRL